jgi:hypothetical protein
MNRYGSGRVPVLQREIEKVAYPGLDLSGLLPNAIGQRSSMKGKSKTPTGTAHGGVQFPTGVASQG